MIAARSERPREHAPLHVQIELTWRCSWRCVHCYQDDHGLAGLALEQLRALIGQLARCGTLHVVVTGGEPLARRDAFEVLAAIRSTGMAITLYTNGHHIDDRAADRLAAEVAGVELTLLGGEAAVHDRLAGVAGAFDRAWRAIRLLHERDVDVVVKTPLLRPALASLPALDRDLAALGITWSVDPEIARTYAGSEAPRRYALTDEELRRFFVAFPRFDTTRRLTIDPGAPRGMCLAARQFCFIDARGDVYPCLSFKSACDADEAAGLQAQARLGNVLEAPFERIWREAAIAHRIREASAASFSTCGSCQSVGCRPCMAQNWEEHRELFEPARAVCSLTEAAMAARGAGFVAASRLTRIAGRDRVA